MHFETNKMLYKYNLLLSYDQNGGCRHKGQLSLGGPRHESQISIPEEI